MGLREGATFAFVVMYYGKFQKIPS